MKTLLRRWANSFLDEVQIVLAVMLAYLFTFALVNFGILVLQNLLVIGGGEGVFFASLVFLPHGVRLLAAFVLGARSILPLFLSSAVISWSTLDIGEHSIWFGIPGAVCCFLAFRLFSYTGVLIESSAQMFLMWRQLLLVGFLGGVLNGLGIMLIYWIEGAPEVMIMSRLLGYIAGDTIGAFVLLLGVLWVSRVWRKVS